MDAYSERYVNRTEFHKMYVNSCSSSVSGRVIYDCIIIFPIFLSAQPVNLFIVFIFYYLGLNCPSKSKLSEFISLTSTVFPMFLDIHNHAHRFCVKVVDFKLALPEHEV